MVCFAVLSFSMEETCISGVGDLDKKSHLPAILCSGFLFFFFSPCNQIRHQKKERKAPQQFQVI